MPVLYGNDHLRNHKKSLQAQQFLETVVPFCCEIASLPTKEKFLVGRRYLEFAT